MKYLRCCKNKPNAFSCLIVDGDLQYYFGVCCCETFIHFEVLESQNIFSRFLLEIMRCSRNCLVQGLSACAKCLTA